MEDREHVNAANALIHWFNSQEISQQDALIVMAKVIAKVIVGSLTAPHTKAQREILNDATDAFHLGVVHEINDRLFITRKDRK